MEQDSVIMNTSRLIWDCWEELAQKNPEREAIVHWTVLNEPYRWTYAILLAKALDVASQLRSREVKKGDVCAIIMRHNAFFYPIYMGISAIGAIPAVLAYPNERLHPDKFNQGLIGMAKKSGLDWILTERELQSAIEPLVIDRESSIKGILFPLDWMQIQQPDKIDKEYIKSCRKDITCNMPFLLQHSSGTTGLQKAVVLSHQALLEHVQSYAQAIRLTKNDKVISWLPLYHDMGLIAAFLMPLIFGVPSILIDPFEWIVAPVIYLEAITKEKPNLTWLPNFAYNFMAERIHNEELGNIDLSSMRMFINCSEVVRATSHEVFLNRFKNCGLKKESLAACYAMAETTFAVTQSEPGVQARQISKGRDSLAKGAVEISPNDSTAKICVSSGKTISGCFVKIVGGNSVELPEDKVGTIVIKSNSLFDGYRNNVEKTKQVLKDGWYTSGDLGFLHEGEYFIIGRGDDVIITTGKNVFPEDIEDAINKVDGVIPGRVVAFGIDNEELGTEDICVIAETAGVSDEQKEALILKIKQAGMSIDVTISQVYLVSPHWLIKSSSGKISRKTNKVRILSVEGTKK